MRRPSPEAIDVAERIANLITLALVILTLVYIENERASRNSTIDDEFRAINCRQIRLYPDTDAYARQVRKNNHCPPYNPNADLPPKLQPGPTPTATKIITRNGKRRVIVLPTRPAAPPTSPVTPRTTAPRATAAPTPIRRTQPKSAPSSTAAHTRTVTRTAPPPKVAPTSSGTGLCILGNCVTVAPR